MTSIYKNHLVYGFNAIFDRSLSPVVFTELMGVEPIESWSSPLNEPRWAADWYPGKAGWVHIEYCYDSIDISESIHPLIFKIKESQNSLRLYHENNGAMYELSLAIYLKDGSPVMHFGSEVISVLSGISCAIDIDVYPLWGST